jgi:hypothetical protein
MMKNKKWYCPHCSQTSSRQWNLKKHIERKHQGRGQPIREDGWHSISTNISSAAHFIPNMMSLQNDNNYHPNQKYQLTLSSASPYSKKEDPSKKRDILEEILEVWWPSAQKMKEILEIIKTFNEFSSFYSSSQQPNIITSLGRTPIIRPIIPPVTTTPLQQTQPTQLPQEQEQKKENVNLLTALIANLFITSTL